MQKHLVLNMVATGATVVVAAISLVGLGPDLANLRSSRVQVTQNVVTSAPAQTTGLSGVLVS